MKRNVLIVTVIVIVFIIAISIFFTCMLKDVFAELKEGDLCSSDTIWIKDITYDNNVLKIDGILNDRVCLISKYRIIVEGECAYLSVWRGFFENEIAPTPKIDVEYSMPSNVNYFYLKGKHEDLRELWNREDGVVKENIDWLKEDNF